MKYFRIVVFLAVLLGIASLYNISLTMHMTPAGEVGEITTLDFFASLIYIFFWVCMSIVAGFKGLKGLFIAGVIYACLPFIGALGFLFISNPSAIIVMCTFYIGVTVQGISYWLQFALLPMIVIGYSLGHSIRKLRSKKV